MPGINQGIVPRIMLDISKGTALGIALSLELGIMLENVWHNIRYINVNVNDHDSCDRTFWSWFIIVAPKWS